MRYFYNLFNKTKVEPKKELYSLDEVKSRLNTYIEWCEKHPILHFFDSLHSRLHFLPSDIRHQVRLFIDFFRRGKRGFGNTDTWCYSSYLARIIYTGITFLKSTKMGCPILANHDEALDPNFVENGKQWDIILDTIIETFKTAEKIAQQDLVYISTKEYTFDKWLEYYKQTKAIHEDCDSKGYEVHVMDFQECQDYENGFDLFKKHFFDLWD